MDSLPVGGTSCPGSPGHAFGARTGHGCVHTGGDAQEGLPSAAGSLRGLVTAKGAPGGVPHPLPPSLHAAGLGLVSPHVPRARPGAAPGHDAGAGMAQHGVQGTPCGAHSVPSPVAGWLCKACPPCPPGGAPFVADTPETWGSWLPPLALEMSPCCCAAWDVTLVAPQRQEVALPSAVPEPPLLLAAAGLVPPKAPPAPAPQGWGCPRVPRPSQPDVRPCRCHQAWGRTGLTCSSPTAGRSSPPSTRGAEL